MSYASVFDPAQITAAVLAGGEGRRMDGRDKGLLLLAGKPLIAHAVSALKSQVGTILICANRHGRDYANFGRVLPDAAQGFRGPLAGIATALAQCATTFLLTVPVDGPDLSHDLARRLHAAMSLSNAAVAVCHDGLRRQPLFALYRIALAQSAGAALAQNLPVWRWQDQQQAIEVDFSDAPRSFDNLNTSEGFLDWEHTHDF